MVNYVRFVRDEQRVGLPLRTQKPRKRALKTHQWIVFGIFFFCNRTKCWHAQSNPFIVHVLQLYSLFLRHIIHTKTNETRSNAYASLETIAQQSGDVPNERASIWLRYSAYGSILFVGINFTTFSCIVWRPTRSTLTITWNRLTEVKWKTLCVGAPNRIRNRNSICAYPFSRAFRTHTTHHTACCKVDGCVPEISAALAQRA